MSTGMARGNWRKREQKLVAELKRLSCDHSRKKLVMFQFDDRRLECEWSTALEKWGISCEPVTSLESLMSRLQETQLILFNANRIDALPFSLIASSSTQIPLIAIGKDIETLLKAQLLEFGVEDCIETTCHIREMVARVRAILRRLKSAESKGSSQRRFNWAFNPVRREVHAPNGASVCLNEIEFDLMIALIESPNKVVSADELREAVILANRHRSKVEIARAISKIRSKLVAINTGSQLIQTVQRKGYRLCNECFE